MFEIFFENLKSFGWFDGVFLFLILYNTFQSLSKGFVLSLLSFLKWVFALILTIIFLPQLQPWVSDYVDSPFLNQIGLGIILYVLFLFIIILSGKTLSRSIKWTGMGSLDKTFGLFFGVFKGYVVSVCLFSIINWVYPFNNWKYDVDNSIAYNFVEKGSMLLIKEFPTREDLIDTKDNVQNL